MAYNFSMRYDQQRFESGMKHIFSISREEMKRRLAEDKVARQAARIAKVTSAVPKPESPKRPRSSAK